ncbi:cytochrome d ubiquinol oxidase subunit II [Terribacillus aidingensis]|uniref:cytochrome d ubiquinol oxidase subunit II n=1 Tax=Terribacillus aidingensis TaxID=586416 RepID=UPI00344F9ECB
MSYEVLGLSALWFFLFAYLIIASIDFGAGFFAYYAKQTKKDHILNRLIARYLSPVWEITNVFFIFFYYGLAGFFPDAGYYYGSAMLIPGSIILVLIGIRGSFYAFENYGSRSSLLYTFLYGASGLLIPAAISTGLTISEGGFLREEGGSIHLRYTELLTNPFSWAVVFLAIVSVLYISANFLTYYANKAGDEPARKILRSYALFWSAPQIIASLTAFIAISRQNPEHYNNMLDLWWMFGLSILFFLAAVYFIYKERNYGLSFICVMLQFFFALLGYGIGHMPYILYDQIQVTADATLPEMGTALLLAFAGGLLMLIPSLILVMRMFLFDAEYVKGKK